MNDIAIQIENLSKQYRLGIIGGRTLSGDINRWWAKARGKPDPLVKIGQEHLAERDGEYIWALRDVSFEVRQGEVLGIIGRNGAGKSTLLKILSRVTAPTTGEVKVRGRIASLLEVGTGFHPELTGRENIYLNGAILGMSRQEVARKFDEIVDFAEIEKFIDTPVKRYSSGMYVRLAFAVAAHLEPEILLVDEVLAVGDASFQKKCLGKMGEVAKEGRTVMFVSHNMAAVASLCPRAVTVEAGRLVFDGLGREAIEVYLGRNVQSNGNGFFRAAERTTMSVERKGRIEAVEFRKLSGVTTSTFGIGEPFQIEMHLKLERADFSIVVGVEIKSPEGMPLANLRSDSQGLFFGPYSDGQTPVVQIGIPGLPFYPGTYVLEPWFGEKKGLRIDQIHQGLTITLEPKGNYEAELFIQKGRGSVIMDCTWDSHLATDASEQRQCQIAFADDIAL